MRVEPGDKVTIPNHKPVRVNGEIDETQWCSSRVGTGVRNPHLNRGYNEGGVECDTCFSYWM